MPTAGISLVREHTERIRPPRALWVPFELGRPLGPPNQPEFQIAVLRALLGLFAQAAGPVIGDYGVEAPASSDGGEPWSCVLPLPPLPAAASPTERREQVLQAEVGFLAPWYGEAVQRKGRTAYGLSGIEAERAPELADFIAAWASGESPEPPAGAVDRMPAALRSTVDDLKSFYLEAAAVQPGKSATTAYEMNRWLYHDTRFGEALYDIRDRFAAAADPDVRPPAIIQNVFRERPGSD